MQCQSNNLYNPLTSNSLVSFGSTLIDRNFNGLNEQLPQIEFHPLPVPLLQL